jgi:hypothetical protein
LLQNRWESTAPGVEKVREILFLDDVKLYLLPTAGGDDRLYRTIPIKAKFTEEEKAFWVNQCEPANSLINCAIYHTKQTHYSQLEELGNAFTTYWHGDELCCG